MRRVKCWFCYWYINALIGLVIIERGNNKNWIQHCWKAADHRLIVLVCIYLYSLHTNNSLIVWVSSVYNSTRIPVQVECIIIATSIQIHLSWSYFVYLHRMPTSNNFILWIITVVWMWVWKTLSFNLILSRCIDVKLVYNRRKCWFRRTTRNFRVILQK